MSQLPITLIMSKRYNVMYALIQSLKMNQIVIYLFLFKK